MTPEAAAQDRKFFKALGLGVIGLLAYAHLSSREEVATEKTLNARYPPVMRQCLERNSWVALTRPDRVRLCEAEIREQAFMRRCLDRLGLGYASADSQVAICEEEIAEMEQAAASRR